MDCSGASDQQRSMEQVMNNKKNALLEVQTLFIYCSVCCSLCFINSHSALTFCGF